MKRPYIGFIIRIQIVSLSLKFTQARRTMHLKTCNYKLNLLFYLCKCSQYNFEKYHKREEIDLSMNDKIDKSDFNDNTHSYI